MIYKTDWEEMKARQLAWWRREEVDRPMLSMTPPRTHPLPHDPAPPAEDGRALRLDFEGVLARQEALFAERAFLAESFPYVAPDLGPGSVGTFLGTEPIFDLNTVWYKPCFANLQEATIRLDEHNPWWQWTLRSAQQAIARAQGRYLVAMPDLIENLDTLAALVGTRTVLFGLKDCPQEIHRLQRELLPVWDEIFERLYQIISPRRDGNAFIAFGIWGDGKTAKLQCDISAMLSPAMFAEFVVPYMAQQARSLDYVLYHLDGPGALQHLDQLCAADWIDAIQWMPGAGAPGGADPCWDFIYHKILDAGKGIMAHMHAAEVREFVSRFGRRGVYISVDDVASEEEGIELIKAVTA